MEIREVFKYVSATKFLPQFCGIKITPTIRHKIRGLDGNNKPIDFTEKEKGQIIAGVKKFYHRFCPVAKTA
jgi:hypothetical protein